MCTHTSVFSFHCPLSFVRCHCGITTLFILPPPPHQVKLSDFGMARVLDDHSDVYNLSNLQTKIPIAWSASQPLTGSVL